MFVISSHDLAREVLLDPAPDRRLVLPESAGPYRYFRSSYIVTR